MFQFGGAWRFVWGAKLPKAPRGDGTGLQDIRFDHPFFKCYNFCNIL